MSPAVVTLPVADITQATPRSILLSLDLGGRPFEFVAGQAVLVARHGEAVRRPFSIAISPERCAETGRLELLVGLDSHDAPSAHLSSGVAPAARLDVEGPTGTFTFPETLTHGRVLFVAGGTGIAPLRAMIDHTLRAHADARVSLLYSARRADEFAFMTELRAYEAERRLELHATVTRDDVMWVGQRGRIGRSHFEAVLHDRLDTLCFICGPGTLVSEAVTTLEELGVPREAIRREAWAAPR